jgi:hypothetical protein
MKIIDIINKMYNKEPGKFSFYIDGHVRLWTYKDGIVYGDDLEEDFLNFIGSPYELTWDIIKIQDYVEIDGLPLEYIQNNIPGKLTYKNQTVDSTWSTDLLAAVINKIILEIEEIKKGK